MADPDSPPGPTHHRAAALAAVAVGLLVAAQSRINAALAQRLAPGDGSGVAAGIHAALISFTTGLILLAVALLVLPRLRAGARAVVAALGTRALRPWHLIGGVGGAWLVATQGLTVPTLGVSLFIVAVVAGQTGASLAVDAAGLGPLGRVPVTGRRVIAALLAGAAAAVTAAPLLLSAGPTSARALPLALLVVSAGAGIAVQQALNARVAVASHYPPTAAVVNFLGGAAALAALFAAGSVIAGWTAGPLPAEPVLYLGGPIGTAFIALGAWAVPKVGVLRFALGAIAGQLAGGAALDVLLPQPGVTVGAATFAGLFLTLAAVMIGNRSR